jgi:dolichol kinase
MHPLYNNILVGATTLVYVQALIKTCDFLVRNNIVEPKLSRKLVHVGATFYMAPWPYYDTSHWSWTLAMLVPVAFTVILIVKGAIIKDRNDPDVRAMSRTGDPAELVKGPLYYVLSMSLLGLLFFRTRVAVLSGAVLGFGDGFAQYFGERWGTVKYKTYGRTKSYVGSIAMFATSILGGILLHTLIIGVPSSYVTTVLVIASLVSTVTEAFSPSDFDNFTVPAAAFIVLTLLGVHY